jgi:DNA gyrase inhibitor GyrI
MDTFEVRMVTLEPMRVMAFHGFGEGPEMQAHAKLAAWSKQTGIQADGKTHRVFGFNNPDPTPGSPNYGYDVWITVGPDVKAGGEAQEINFEGGLYAVAHCDVKAPYDDIPQTWQKLVKWLEDSKYKHAKHQWLEEHLTLPVKDGDEFVLDLYLPVRE